MLETIFPYRFWNVALLVLALFAVSFAGNPKNAIASPNQTYLMIGDSRFVGMQEAVGDTENVYWIDRVGAGNGLFFEYADQIDASCDRNAVIIYALGVNDLDASRCIDALNSLVSMGFTHVWFSTVAPVDEGLASTYGYTVTNEQIAWFNYEVASNLPYGVGIIDSYSYLAGRGIETDDGLHYHASTYLDWFTFLTSQAY